MEIKIEFVLDHRIDYKRVFKGLGPLLNELSESLAEKEFLTATEAKKFLGYISLPHRAIKIGLPYEIGSEQHFKYYYLMDWIQNQTHA